MVSAQEAQGKAGTRLGEIVTAIAGANNLENRGGESAFSTASGQVTLEG